MAKKQFNKWEKVGGNRVSVLGGPEPKPKKLTATRMAGVLGYNPWKTDFQMWCEICRVAEPLFEGNKFTEFGKVVEPKLHAFCLEYISPHLKRPHDIFGARANNMYDFYASDPIYGGMWDDLVENRKGERVGIVEYKSSSRPQDWEDGAPANYRIQALQYAWKEKMDDYWVVCTFPEPDDYDNPHDYVVTEENTVIFKYTVSEGFDGHSADELFQQGADWWETHVAGNLSPEYDEKKDKEYLDLMRTSMVELPSDINGLSKQVAALDDKLAALKVKHKIAELEKELKELKDKVLKTQLKEIAEKDGKTAIETDEWRYAKSKDGVKIDEAAMKTDGVYEKYAVAKSGSWTLTRKKD